MDDWGGGISVVLHRGSNCLLSWATDDCIMCVVPLVMPISCHFQDCTSSAVHKSTNVSSTTASTETLTFYLNQRPPKIDSDKFQI